ncbi:MAG TPA: hypothetical protein VMY87_12225 [Armatimonadota bacterium]|nr:hypothetical protein [Armatimonadota bacterium]
MMRGGGRRFPYAIRQRALLENMLRVTQEQRRYLIEGDMKRVEQMNSLLGALLESQKALNEEPLEPGEGADEGTAAELRRLAEELRQESRRNYLLACRGAEFAGFSLCLLTEATEEKAALGRDEGTEGRPNGPRVVDRPA